MSLFLPWTEARCGFALETEDDALESDVASLSSTVSSAHTGPILAFLETTELAGGQTRSRGQI